MNNKSSVNMSAPQLDTLIERASSSPDVSDEQTKHLALALFQKLKAITVCGDDQRRELWLTASRGSIEDFGDYEEYLEAEEVESREEFEDLWLSKYPEPQKWYELITVVYKDIHSVFLDKKLVLQFQNEPKECFPYEKLELTKWLLNAVDEVIASLMAGTYNGFVRDNLPCRKRVGKLLREDYWRIFPDEKAEYLGNIISAQIQRFTKTIQNQPPDSPVNRMSEMTAGSFFDCCRLGYEANEYEGVDKLTPIELYRAHADGRDEGMTSLPQDSPEAFFEWFHDRNRYGGHPWEVCRGGNSTHISLYVSQDENGWWLTLAGSSWGRSVETVKFYLALVEHGFPIYLREGKELAAMLTGVDYIGIVPEGVIPSYCDSYFPGEKMLSFMNLPWEKTDAVEKATVWYPLEEIRLQR